MFKAYESAREFVALAQRHEKNGEISEAMKIYYELGDHKSVTKCFRRLTAKEQNATFMEYRAGWQSKEGT
ncbi:MAG: hypothetical protein ACP5NX_00035 [Candidatus Bilamarchaeaceae archaeon]